MVKIAVASGKGGVGKSMLASSLAILFSQEKNIVALDTDVDAPNLHLWLGEEENWDKVEKLSTNQRPVIDQEECTDCGKCVDVCQFGALSMEGGRLKVNSYFCEGCGACAIVCSDAIRMNSVDNAEIRIKERTDYDFPLISAQLKPGETGSGKIVDEIKLRAEQLESDLVLMDVPAGTGCPVISALKDVDFAVLITEPTLSGLSDLRRVLEIVDHFHITFGVVINKWDINQSLSKQIEKEFGEQLLGKISYEKGIFQSIADLTPVMESDLPAVGEIEKIFAQLKDVSSI
ncbi:MAG: P-loop NTPase [Patescibacteria group bacterium]